MIRTAPLALALALSLLFGCIAVVKEAPSGPQPRENALPAAAATGFVFLETTVRGIVRRFAVFVPRDYDATRAWPAAIFLNGAGECGIDGQRQLTQGLAPAIANDPTAWPMIAIFPQKPDVPSAWADHEDLVMAALEETRLRYRLDPTRLYLTGLSQGGYGTWAIAARHAGMFAAIAPVCGAGDPATMGPALKGVPTWAFHGAEDDVVPPEGSRRMVEAIRAPGGDPKLSNLPDLGHGCWDRAYRDEGLSSWLLEHSLRP